MSSKRPARGWVRLLLVGVGLLAGLALGEVAVRASSPSLPSLAPLDGLDRRQWGDVQRWTSPPTDPRLCGDPSAPLQVPPRVEHHGAYPRTKLWVVGDSLVHGFGVGPAASWPQQLAVTLAEARSTGISLTRLGGPGLGYCGWTTSLTKHLARDAPDALVVQVFADDLELRDLVLVGGKVAAIPRAPLLQHSWLANRLWLAWVSHLGSASPARDSDAAGLQRFQQVVGSALAPLAGDGVPILLVLVPPAGQPRCAADAPGFSDCDWLTTDLDLLAGAVDELGHPWLDLRTVWDDHPPDTLPQEEEAWTTRGRLPVHPGEAGHKVLADQVLVALEPLLPPVGTAPKTP